MARHMWPNGPGSQSLSRTQFSARWYRRLSRRHWFWALRLLPVLSWLELLLSRQYFDQRRCSRSPSFQQPNLPRYLLPWISTLLGSSPIALPFNSRQCSVGSISCTRNLTELGESIPSTFLCDLDLNPTVSHWNRPIVWHRNVIRSIRV